METPFWQKCPICNGLGTVGQFGNVICSVCNGSKIISNLTGKPPAAATFETKSAATNTNFNNVAHPMAMTFDDRHDKENS